MFKPLDSRTDFPAMEREILAWWEEADIPGKYLARNETSDKKFSFIDGPITANNRMAVHHAWGRTYKDLFQRYKTMQGYRQRYQNGFDCQGLWVEVEVEKELGLDSKRDIEEFGIEKFVNLCKERVRKFADIISEQSKRLGYWMDWDKSYYTMSDENNFAIWHFLKVCYERGWIYEGTDVMEWCPRCGTGLSQQEVTEGYREIVHPGLYVRFPLRGRERESLLVWTTTPWTLTSNTGVYVQPDLTYARVRTMDGEVLYLLKSRLGELKVEHEVLEEMLGKTLDGLRYVGPFDELPAQKDVDHRVVLWDEVSETEGTGIVHTAPGAGKEDFKISKERGLSVIAPLDDFGIFVEGFDWLTGKRVSDVNKPIYDSLREKGSFYRVDQYLHRYPVCWRCGTELVFRLVDEWFISMDELRDMVADVTKKVRWIPAFGMQRELDWLKNMDDWMISKKRYWGLALPIYKCSCGHFEVIGSEKELQERAISGAAEFEGHSPHRPWIDAVKIACPKCDAAVGRISDVGNVWLDAGVVPFSTIGYRSDHNYWEEWFPADMVTESFPGQFRGWFYSLLVMSTALENTEPFRNLHSYATMRDEHGEEMHKSKGNAIWFEDGAEKMGVDSMRWLYTRHSPAANLNFGFGIADEVRRQFIIPLWNVFSFFITYANIDGYDPKATAPPVEHRPELDRWILSELAELTRDMTASLDAYEVEVATRCAEEFVEKLSNWYVRRSRRRFWKSDADDDKHAAHATLYQCLVTLTKLIAPIIPFISETMFLNLTGPVGEGRESVHLESYPVIDEAVIDLRLSQAVRLAMRLSSLGRAARSKVGVKVRQPMEEALVKLRSTDEQDLQEQISTQVCDELNIRRVSVLDDEREVAKIVVKADMSRIGPRFGAQTQNVLEALSKADPSEVYLAMVAGRGVTVGGYFLEPEDIVVTSSEIAGYSVVSEGGYSVAVTTEITPELKSEGRAREMVHLVQNMRRSAGFDIADHIITYYDGDEALEEVVVTHCNYICQETLSRELVRGVVPGRAHSEKQQINGLDVILGVVRA